jgi:hypothetical protein
MAEEYVVAVAGRTDLYHDFAEALIAWWQAPAGAELWQFWPPLSCGWPLILLNSHSSEGRHFQSGKCQRNMIKEWGGAGLGSSYIERR